MLTSCNECLLGQSPMPLPKALLECIEQIVPKKQYVRMFTCCEMHVCAPHYTEPLAYKTFIDYTKCAPLAYKTFIDYTKVHWYIHPIISKSSQNKEEDFGVHLSYVRSSNHFSSLVHALE